LRVDRGLDPASPALPTDVAGALPLGARGRVLLPEARRPVGPERPAPRADPGEEEGRRVPRGGRSGRPDRSGPDRHPRDPYVELGRRAAGEGRSAAVVYLLRR